MLSQHVVLAVQKPRGRPSPEAPSFEPPQAQAQHVSTYLAFNKAQHASQCITQPLPPKPIKKTAHTAHRHTAHWHNTMDMSKTYTEKEQHF
jgi:hypothetical protein